MNKCWTARPALVAGAATVVVLPVFARPRRMCLGSSCAFDPYRDRDRFTPCWESKAPSPLLGSTRPPTDGLSSEGVPTMGPMCV